MIILFVIYQSYLEMSAAKPSTGASAVLDGVTVLLDKAVESIKESNTIQNQELAIEIKELKNMVAALQKVSAAPKTTKAKATGAVEATGETTTGGAAPAASTAAKPTITNNSLIWFKQRYTADPEFRKRYVNADIQAALDADESLKKGTDEAKLKAAAPKVWTLIKEQDAKHSDKATKSLMTLFKEEFEQAKKDSAAASTTAQQNVEAVTP
jgi:hypothetical protein